MSTVVRLLLFIALCSTASWAGSNESLAAQNVDIEARLAKMEQWFRERRVTLCGAGLQDYRIVDADLTASRSHDVNHDTRSVRLFSTYQPVPSWCGHTSDSEKWVQVDMQVEKPVYGIVIQGRENLDEWTTVFQVLYKSNESDAFKYVLDENNNPESFAGNVDRNTPHTADFLAPVTARFIRVKIREWHGAPCMRFEILTC